MNQYAQTGGQFTSYQPKYQVPQVNQISQVPQIPQVNQFYNAEQIKYQIPQFNQIPQVNKVPQVAPINKIPQSNQYHNTDQPQGSHYFNQGSTYNYQKISDPNNVTMSNKVSMNYPFSKDINLETSGFTYL